MRKPTGTKPAFPTIDSDTNFTLQYVKRFVPRVMVGRRATVWLTLLEVHFEGLSRVVGIKYSHRLTQYLKWVWVLLF